MEKGLRISYPVHKREPRIRVYFPEKEEETALDEATLLAPQWAKAEGLETYKDLLKAREGRRHIEFEAMLYRV